MERNNLNFIHDCPFGCRHPYNPKKRNTLLVDAVSLNLKIYRVSCFVCGMHGPEGHSRGKAIEYWNKLALPF